MCLDVERWIGPLGDFRPDDRNSSLFQTANRLAHAAWLDCELEDEGVDVWLCHLFFLNDVLYKPTTEADWTKTIEQANRELGIDGVDIPFAGHAFPVALDPNVVLPDLRNAG